MGVALLLVALAAAGTASVLPSGNPQAAAVMALAAAVGVGVGANWLLRALRADPARVAAIELERLLGPAFDDSYALITGPRLPGVRRDLAALLVGPAGVRAIIVRRWRGTYRVRGRGWQYDTRGSRGWIPCRTNPGFEAAAVRDAVARWAESIGQPNLPIEAAIVFPGSYSRIVLEEPDSEVVTADNVPWWANRIGRVQRLDAARGAHFVEAVLAAAEPRADASATLRRALR